MTVTNFEPVYAALFTLLETLSGSFNTMSRRWRMPNAVSPELRPALFQVQTDEQAFSNAEGMPTRWHLLLDLVVYGAGSGDDDNYVPSTELNALLLAIRGAIAPTAVGDKQTLGGLVSNCFLTGKTKIVENVFGSMPMAILQVQINIGY